MWALLACLLEHLSLRWAQEKGTRAEDLEEGILLLARGELLPCMALKMAGWC